MATSSNHRGNVSLYAAGACISRSQTKLLRRLLRLRLGRTLPIPSADANDSDNMQITESMYALAHLEYSKAWLPA
jgi:hypothetical protein